MKRILVVVATLLAACGLESGESVDPEPAASRRPGDGDRGSSPVDAGADSDVGRPAGTVVPDPSWRCASSAYEGEQLWTCAGGAIHRCEGDSPVRIDCVHGCVFGPLGTDDRCNATAPAPLPMPKLEIAIADKLFKEAEIRPPLEEGLRYALDRMQRNIALDGKKPPARISLKFSLATTPYAYAWAYPDDRLEVFVPRGYPITGNNQNMVVNISVHEFGHVLARQLIGPDSLRTLCTNEGLGSWIAGKYWMNDRFAPVPSHKAAAKVEIEKGLASATLSKCVSASDAWYKVYATYIEYLELFVPDGIRRIASGAVPANTYEADWQKWMKE